MSIAGDTILIGAGGNFDSGTPTVGAAYVFSWLGGVWTKQSPILWPPSTTTSTIRYGYAVALASGDVVVGAPADWDGTANTGAVYAYPYACGFGPGIATNRWSMFGLSCKPETLTTVRKFFSGLIPTNYDGGWVVYEKSNTAGAYAKLSLDSAIEQGRGYWFISFNDLTKISFKGSATALSTSSHCGSPGCYEISLTKPTGSATYYYNLISHPLAFDVPWANVRVLCGNTTYSPQIAEQNTILSKTYWVYNAVGGGYDPYDDQGPSNIGTLRAGDGIWVKVYTGCTQPLTLLVPPFDPQTVHSLRAMAPGQLGAGEWYTQLVADAPAAGLKTGKAALGQLNSSLPGFDSHDLPALAPTFTPNLTIAFSHSDWGAKTGDYGTDFHTVHAGSDTWTFQVRSDVPGRRVILSWTNTGAAPQNMSLLDATSGDSGSCAEWEVRIHDDDSDTVIHVASFQLAVTLTGAGSAVPAMEDLT